MPLGANQQRGAFRSCCTRVRLPRKRCNWPEWKMRRYRQCREPSNFDFRVVALVQFSGTMPEIFASLRSVVPWFPRLAVRQSLRAS
jgi:hypothetical protein